MNRIAAVITAAALAFALLVPAALAVATERNLYGDTSLRISAPHLVASGHAFTIKGKLVSSKTDCEGHSTVRILRNGKALAKTRTADSGAYSFETRTKVDASYQAVYPGRPRICGASTSRIVTVKVG